MEKWNARNSNVFEFLVIFNEIMNIIIVVFEIINSKSIID